MSASSRGGSAVSALLRNSPRVCSQCRASQPPYLSASSSPLSAARRFYVQGATSASSPETTLPSSPSSSPLESTPTDAAAATTRYRIRAGVILTRPPLLTRELTPFESSFFLYQKRLNERLTPKFRPKLYFKTDTAAQLDWRIKLKERHGVAAKDIGRYNPRGRTAWNDELLVGSRTSSPEEMYDRLLHDAQSRISEDGEVIPVDELVPVERPMPRRTEADEEHDVRRLDRALDRTLYLVVKRQLPPRLLDGKQSTVWVFPTADVLTHEALHETAARALAESAGVNMNTWIVGRVPVAHYVRAPRITHKDEDLPLSRQMQQQNRTEKVFFLKGRIMAGQANLAGNLHGLTDFQWLTSDELKDVVFPDYYRSVENMFDAR
ncbi:39S mitochondrial ribosomal protein L46-domain-containing protein [Lasiosphaeria miniovina]|uniref:Large ribosomal subunit protein mL46 n=1 Tax=Lasiosphaeria miniovina TaxID=1954250 RepID=A0AA40AVN7_9PEZI|nr:39S mitochondrial ribosomal protein L46-domain-containing protein [Lasiosphaeria miniovina]KAK0722798.1 39S mitochondrial ribosomal protein L46-domain-containing protein [Lasiosphaeria miniovina]